jgi:hypothetical protein
MATACIAMAVPANAATSLLDVAGAGDSSQTILAGQGAAVSFRFASAFNDVSISAGLLCIACNGTAWLLKDQIGAATQLADIVATANYNLTTSASPLFTGLDLAAGDYYLLLTIGGSTGGAGWLASGMPSITLARTCSTMAGCLPKIWTRWLIAPPSWCSSARPPCISVSIPLPQSIHLSVAVAVAVARCRNRPAGPCW